jgi:hypothetical protein
MWAALLSGALGAVFVWSAVAKRVEFDAWLLQAAEFGVPRRVAGALPWIELLLGACLIAQLWRPWPAVLAGVLLIVFSLAIATRLAQGRRPPCACFGASSRPISAWTLVRNACLLVLAVAAVVSAR